MIPHLIILPILLPLAAAAVLLLSGTRNRPLHGVISIAASVGALAVAVALVLAANTGEVAAAYRLGNWPTQVAIVLVGDRLAALMVLLASLLGLVNAVFSLGRWARLGPYYPVFSQFLLMGLNGAFLTGDLFNLFVFFEILLAASYALLLHGSGSRRVGAGLHYIVINLIASLFFLVGVSLIFGVTGTLNMAVLSQRIPALAGETRPIFHVGAAILGSAFLVKAAAWPLGFWLPRTYDAATAPAAAIFVIMTKVGVYALARLGLLLFGAEAGTSAGFGDQWGFVMGVLTIGVGLVGMLAARDLGRLAGYSVLVSAGTLLAALAFREPAVITGALFYMSVSTLAAAAFYLLGGLVGTDDGDDEFDAPPLLEAYDPDGDGLYTEEDERAVILNAPIGLISAGFLICTLLIAGLPPLPGFLAKVGMIAPLLDDPHGPFPSAGLVLAAIMVGSSLFSLIALARAGIQILWAEPDRIAPTIRLHEGATVGALLLGLLALTFAVGGPLDYLANTAQDLLEPSRYVAAVLEPEAGS
ncbi:MAG: monovalent cation/H+ antiporter subunit D [Brevundimonas sp.]|uniref:monovalent cation/H+ antiporter subunit D n=1 Tax=Brevundimonas sp. TaxID=1871086 RepID=UPI0025BD61D3|nr:monovalent cation/H+ antiporter subunit D [Brevundimonas sp.]MBX3478504.1 monovalent cation/H+ antiporter subunit D [Brevundimonas sp.]